MLLRAHGETLPGAGRKRKRGKRFRRREVRKFKCNLTFFESLLFILGWMVVTFISFGLAAPFFIFSLIKYIVNRSVLVEGGVERGLICRLSIGEDFLFLIGWTLLTIVTCGLASPFFIFSMIKYTINRIEVG